jgi:hypothetical protein
MWGNQFEILDFKFIRLEKFRSPEAGAPTPVASSRQSRPRRWLDFSQNLKSKITLTVAS